jgi:Zn-dependent membrane protease YugP
MVVLAVLGTALFFALVFGPAWWVRRTLATHGADRPDLPGTGGEFARHLLDEAGLSDVQVETTEQGDHYDPRSRKVRLLPQHHDRRSVAAVAVAAHEVAHAIQHARGEKAFAARTELVGKLIWIDRLATGIVLFGPVLLALVKSPWILVVDVIAALALLSTHVIVHVLTLPVEIDASFGKALPVLEGRRYLSEQDLPAARSVLKAAAYTYVAGALATLLNVARWFRII